MLNENQKKVLVLHSQRKELQEIVNRVPGITTIKGVKYALRHGKINLEKSLDDVYFALKNKVLDDSQVKALKKMVDELT